MVHTPGVLPPSYKTHRQRFFSSRFSFPDDVCHHCEKSAQANRWWLHLYRLLTGEWSEDLTASNPLQPQTETEPAEATTTTAVPQPAAAAAAAAKLFRSPDWPSARAFFPNWLWSGLVLDDPKRGAGAGEALGGLDTASLEHARGGCIFGNFLGFSKRLLRRCVPSAQYLMVWYLGLAP